jgi:flagellar operon protein
VTLIQSVRTAAAQALNQKSPVAPRTAGPQGEFARVLREKLDQHSIAVSAHAADRMVRRGLVPSETTIDQLHSAFELASQKGAREALFLLDDLAVIASVPNRTVKTALGRSGLEAGVFTHIDAAIVMSPNHNANSDNSQTVNQSPRSNGWTSTEGAAVQHGGNYP